MSAVLGGACLRFRVLVYGLEVLVYGLGMLVYGLGVLVNGVGVLVYGIGGCVSIFSMTTRLVTRLIMG